MRGFVRITKAIQHLSPKERVLPVWPQSNSYTGVTSARLRSTKTSTGRAEFAKRASVLWHTLPDHCSLLQPMYQQTALELTFKSSPENTPADVFAPYGLTCTAQSLSVGSSFSLLVPGSWTSLRFYAKSCCGDQLKGAYVPLCLRRAGS